MPIFHQFIWNHGTKKLTDYTKNFEKPVYRKLFLLFWYQQSNAAIRISHFCLLEWIIEIYFLGTLNINTKKNCTNVIASNTNNQLIQKIRKSYNSKAKYWKFKILLNLFHKKKWVTQYKRGGDIWHYRRICRIAEFFGDLYLNFFLASWMTLFSGLTFPNPVFITLFDCVERNAFGGVFNFTHFDDLLHTNLLWNSL